MKKLKLGSIVILAAAALANINAAVAETEGERNFRLNHEAAKREYVLRQKEAQQELMRDKSHDGVNRYKTGKESSVGINPTKGRDGVVVDYTSNFKSKY